MNFVITSRRLPTGAKPVHLCVLSTLLIRFGINGEPIYGRSAWKPQFSKRTRRSLWDINDLVRAHWRKMVWHLHPDHGGSHEKFATMSAIHDMIRFRLRKKGIDA